MTVKINNKLLNLIPEIENLKPLDRISRMKDKIINTERYLSLEQALIITKSYNKTEGKSRTLQRAAAIADSLSRIDINIDEDELIVGNRTVGIRDGVVFPEAGISWVKKEIETLSGREQDNFNVREKDKIDFFEKIVPFWENRTLEDYINTNIGTEISEISGVVKINQKDHAQGHIIPDVKGWLEKGPSCLLAEAELLQKGSADSEVYEFYESVIVVLKGATKFIERYSLLAESLSKVELEDTRKQELDIISNNCRNITNRPPVNFHEALQSLWFLFVILQMESNASSFSPGRIDQYLFPFFKKDLENGILSLSESLELVEALHLNFNKIVYMRNAEGARYFAGFPIGFNITLGGQDQKGEDAANALTFMFLKAQEHLGLPQPNMTVRLFRGSSDIFIDSCSRVIGLGSGMPQIVNDESIIPSLKRAGIKRKHAVDYGLVGCVELSTQGNNLGWSDAAMFNLLKALELCLNDGICLLTGKSKGFSSGSLESYSTFKDLLDAYKKTIDFFIKKMVVLVEFVDMAHAVMMPSPFLSSVIDNCLVKGMDVTAGGARYNLSGIQAIQVANVADSLAVIKQLVFDDSRFTKEEIMNALRENWEKHEYLRQTVIHKVPKYGNDVSWVDELGSQWADYFAHGLEPYQNVRGGPYHMGLYTVSAHVPMGKNVGASPDGRFSESPLADGGVSPMYGQDIKGPTAVLKSVSKLSSSLASNGTLLNLKFLPSFFTNPEDRKKFNQFLRTFLELNIHHVQFNVVNKKDLLEAQKYPEKYKNLTIRVAGYTAYFTELAMDLQNEIIERTAHEL
jgi:pyruvate formate-lyase/glycerol dehydratase family glycyl radical enzyme